MKKSFTLIELLVVIAIIGMLSAMLLPNFMSARERARDTQRKSDLNQIQKAFEMYKQDQTPQEFPATIPTANSQFASGSTVYMSKFPADPSSTATNTIQYGYQVDNNTLTYTLCACLENKADPKGSASCSVCGTCTSGLCYTVTQP